MNQTQIMTLLLPKEAVQLMFEITQTTELISGVKHLELAKQTLRLVLDFLWDIIQLAQT